MTTPTVDDDSVNVSPSPLARFCLLLIRGYRWWLSPWIGNQCKFYPTCSHYMQTAILRYGAIKGVWLGIGRLLRCNPWHAGGIDWVPGTEPHSTTDAQDQGCACSQHGDGDSPHT